MIDESIRILDELILKAVIASASDIHLEPQLKQVRVRVRVDGILQEMLTLSSELGGQIISRIKVLSSMNVVERRVPQDGKFRPAGLAREVDIRASSFPTVYGEKMVLRILDRGHQPLNLVNLGLSNEYIQQITSLAQLASGFFLVTGPTGSGKTTTLHAMLQEVDRTKKNVSTLEDPVEYHIDGITQGHVAPDLGFSFECGIRALLRQDPDVIMVGEIRDRQTAQVAIQASLTGHLVLTTLHTNDAVGALMRMLDMGIEPFLLTASLTGVLAQRLIRVLCRECMVSYQAHQEEVTFLQNLGATFDTLYTAPGCTVCNFTGYKGRVGVFELLMVDHQVKDCIARKPSVNELYLAACQAGMMSIKQDMLSKLQQGITSMTEIARVLF